jgi:hypothetical protein
MDPCRYNVGCFSRKFHRIPLLPNSNVGESEWNRQSEARLSTHPMECANELLLKMQDIAHTLKELVGLHRSTTSSVYPPALAHLDEKKCVMFAPHCKTVEKDEHGVVTRLRLEEGTAQYRKTFELNLEKRTCSGCTGDVYPCYHLGAAFINAGRDVLDAFHPQFKMSTLLTVFDGISLALPNLDAIQPDETQHLMANGHFANASVFRRGAAVETRHNSRGEFRPGGMKKRSKKRSKKASGRPNPGHDRADRKAPSSSSDSPTDGEDSGDLSDEGEQVAALLEGMVDSVAEASETDGAAAVQQQHKRHHSDESEALTWQDDHMQFEE